MKNFIRYVGASGATRTRVGGALAVAVTVAFWLFAPDATAGPPAKPALLSGFEVVDASSGNPSTTATQAVRVECPLGKGPVAGGYSFSNSGVEEYSLIDNRPSGQLTVQEPGGDPILINYGWVVTVLRTDGQPDNWAVKAYAVCVDIE